MDQGLIEIALWIGGAFLLIISGLLGWIVTLISSGKTDVNIRLEKHETWILAQQREIHEIAKTTGEAIAVLKATIRKKG